MSSFFLRHGIMGRCGFLPINASCFFCCDGSIWEGLYQLYYRARPEVAFGLVEQ
jgi:hypothetical protein